VVDVSASSPLRPARTWPWVAVTAAVVLLAAVAMWRLALPRPPSAADGLPGIVRVCPSVYPAPPGCAPERIPVAAVGSATLAVLLGAQVAGARLLPRWRRAWLVGSTAVVIVGALVAYYLVRYT
jgi:hypothetical protein